MKGFDFEPSNLSVRLSKPRGTNLTLKGRLKKRADNRWWSWNEREFELYGKRLLYFRDGVLNGEFDLSDSICSMSNDPLTFTLTCVGTKWLKETDRKVKGRRQTMYLRGDDSETVRKWIATIRKASSSKQQDDEIVTTTISTKKKRRSTKKKLSRQLLRLDSAFCVTELIREGNIRLVTRKESEVVLTPSLLDDNDNEKHHFCKLFSNQCEPQLMIYNSEDRVLPEISVSSLRDYCIREISLTEDDDNDDIRHSSGGSTIQDALDGKETEDSFQAWTNGIELYIDNGRVHRRVTSTYRFLVENVTEMNNWIESFQKAGCRLEGTELRPPTPRSGPPTTPSKEQTEEIIMEGWVEKQGRLNTSFQRRWLKLSSMQPQLIWKDDPFSKVKNGIPTLGEGYVVRSAHGVRFGVQIWHETHRNLIFRTSNQDEADAWIRALLKCVKKDSKILPTPTKSSRGGGSRNSSKMSFVKRLRRLSSSDCMTKKDFEKALTRKYSSASKILFDGYLERHTTGETTPSKRSSRKIVTSNTKKRTGVRLGRAWMTSNWKKCWVCAYVRSSFDERDEARGVLLISADSIDRDEISEILVTKRKGVEILDIDMATEIMDVSLSASTSNGDEETEGVSHFSIYAGNKDIYFRGRNVEQWRDHVTRIVDHIQGEMQRRMQRSSEIASKQLSLLESNEKNNSTMNSNLVILKQNLGKRGKFRKSRREVILTTTHLRWSTSSSSEYRSVSLSEVDSVEDGDSALEFRVKVKSPVEGQKEGSRYLYFFADDRRHGTLWKVILQRVLAAYEANKQKSILKSGWLVVKEEEDLWRTRYVKLYCRQRRVRLFVFADATTSVPIRSHEINEKTYAETINEEKDVSFAFRVFRRRHRRLEYRNDDDENEDTTSMSDMAHDEDEEMTDEEEDSKNEDWNDFIAHSSNKESTETWIELIQSLAVKLDMPAWMMPWHLWNDETRLKFAKSRFESIFNQDDNDDDDNKDKDMTKIYDRARDEIDRLHSTCVHDRTLPRHDILDFMSSALIREMHSQKFFRENCDSIKEEQILPLYVSSNRLLLRAQSATTTEENILNKISSLVENIMNRYVRKERELLSSDITQIVRTFRVEDKTPKFRGTSAVKGHNRVVVATRLGHDVKKRLESSLERVSHCETEMRSAILHECVSVAETYVTRLFSRFRAPIFNGSYDTKLVLSLANDVREVQLVLTSQTSTIFYDTNIDQENDEIENLESVSWARLSKLDRLISQHVENLGRWILERFVKSKVIVPTIESAYLDRPLHDHVFKLEKVLSAFFNFVESELLSMCRWDVAKGIMIACSDVCTYYVTYNMLKSALSPVRKKKETQEQESVFNILFSGGYSTTSTAGTKTTMKSTGFSDIELHGVPDFAIGEEVKVKVLKKRAWFQGHVVSVNPESGMYSIAVENGTNESNVRASRIRSSSTSTFSLSSFAERVPSVIRSIRYGLSLLHEPFSICLKEKTQDRELLDPEEILSSISEIIEPVLSERLRTDKEVQKAFKKLLFDSFGTASGKIDRKQFVASLECKPQRFDRSVLTDFSVLRSSLWSLPYIVLRRELRSKPIRTVRLVKIYSSRFLYRSMQGLGCIQSFLTQPVTEFRKLFENTVKTHHIDTKIMGQMLRLLMKCRNDINSDNMDESIAAWERFYADDVGDVERKTNTCRMFDALLHSSSLSSFLVKQKKPVVPPSKPSRRVSTKDQIQKEQRLTKLTGFLRDFYGKYNKSNVKNAAGFAQKWMGNEKALKSALMQKYPKSKAEINWSELDGG